MVSGAYYTHQGWLNPSQSHLVMDDEKDEQQYEALNGHTRTMIWDVSDLSAPFINGNFYSEETSIGALRSTTQYQTVIPNLISLL